MGAPACGAAAAAAAVAATSSRLFPHWVVGGRVVPPQ